MKLWEDPMDKHPEKEEEDEQLEITAAEGGVEEGREEAQRRTKTFGCGRNPRNQHIRLTISSLVEISLTLKELLLALLTPWPAFTCFFHTRYMMTFYIRLICMQLRKRQRKEIPSHGLQ